VKFIGRWVVLLWLYRCKIHAEDLSLGVGVGYVVDKSEHIKSGTRKYRNLLPIYLFHTQHRELDLDV
jgi:hypothetical protein